MHKLIGIAAAAACAFAACSAQAVVAPFGGTSAGTDPLGQTWSASNAFISSWGEPGLGDGVETFNAGALSNGAGSFATEFDFIFLKGVAGVIDSAGGDAMTSFYDVTTGQAWHADFVSPQEVDFTAPAGSKISAGDKFFVNVVFTGPVDTSRFSFAGLWSDAGGSVPEPATWAMMLVGLGLAGGALRSRRGAALA